MQDKNDSDEKIAQMLQSLRPLRPIDKEPHQSDEMRSAADKDWRRKMEESFAAASPDGERKNAEVEKPETYLATMARRALNSPRLPKLDPLSPNVVIAAESHPGFSPDLTSWSLTIDQNGHLHQYVLVSTSIGEILWELRDEQVEIGAEEVTRILTMAEKLGFSSFRKVLDISTTDLGSSRLTFRLNGQTVTHEEDGNGEMTEENTNRFYQLWKEVRRHAPYPKR